MGVVWVLPRMRLADAPKTLTGTRPSLALQVRRDKVPTRLLAWDWIRSSGRELAP